MKNIIKFVTLFSIIVSIYVFSGCATTAHNRPSTENAISSELLAPSCKSNEEEPEQTSNLLMSSTPYHSEGNTTSQDTQEAQTILDQALDLCQLSQEFWQTDEPDNAIQALDQAYSLLLSTPLNDNTDISRQKEDLRFMISKRILEIHASRHIVTKGTSTSIPIVLNNYVNAEIKRFTEQERNFFIRSYERSGKYRPAILKALKAAGLPEELSWLPLIESGFKVRALSRARALGLWQFIPSTGYKFGLKRDRFVDERLNPEQATRAAIAYLKELHQIFGDWSTVLAAYNCGEGRVLRTIRSQNINYLDNFWDLYDRLPRETARYVPRFLATLHIINNLEKYGFTSLTPEAPLDFDIITVSKQIKLEDLARTTKISYDVLKELNPELRYGIIPPRDFSLKVPSQKGSMVLANINKIQISTPPQRAHVYHRVKKGESLSAIASRYHTSVKAIASVNHINRCNHIVAGKLLKIPGSRNSSCTKTSYRSSKHQPIFKYKVKKGDTLWQIARKYDTTTRKLLQLNHLSTSRLFVGQMLKIQRKVYRVKSGDSPFTIASRHNMDLNRLLQLNHLTNKSKIYPGQKLFIE
jgi:membrane-bound lytic murein transglycosylase D